MDVEAFENQRAADVLPTDSLADLLRAAIEDARKLDRDQYRPDAGVWHGHYMQGVCLFCDAGAVIAGRLGAKPWQRVDPDTFEDMDLNRALHALDDAREGRWGDAYDKLDQPRRARAMWDGAEREMLELAHGDFQGWGAFDEHLDTLERAADQLDDFESGTPPLHG